MKVEVRYLPVRMEIAYILYEGIHYPVCTTDMVANGKAKRYNLPVIDYSKRGVSSNV
jgi:hypothetical protein